MNKYIKYVGLAIVAIVFIATVYKVFFVSSTSVAGVPQINPNTNFSHFSSTVYAGGGLIDGGGAVATSTNGAADQLAEGEISPYNVIQYGPNSGAVTLTLPLFTQQGVLSNQGDEVTFWVQNTSSTTNNVTLAAAAPTTTMLLATTTAILYGNNTGSIMQVDCVRTGGVPYTGNFASTTCFIAN